MFGITDPLTKLANRELELFTQKRGLMASLKAAEQTTGDALAEGEAGREIAALNALKNKIAAIDLGVATLRARRSDVITVEYREQAEKLRAEATGKRRELATLQGKANKLWAQLNDLLGMSFPDDMIGLRGDSNVDKLEIAIRELDSKATVLESATVPEMGSLQLDDVTRVDTVIEAVLMHRSAAPSAETVQAWVDSVTANARKRNADIESAPKAFTIHWRNGEITDASTIFVRSLAKVAVMPGATGVYRPQPGTFDIASATFKATA